MEIREEIEAIVMNVSVFISNTMEGLGVVEFGGGEFSYAILRYEVKLSCVLGWGDS
jgi:hypothetical protein